LIEQAEMHFQTHPVLSTEQTPQQILIAADSHVTQDLLPPCKRQRKEKIQDLTDPRGINLNKPEAQDQVREDVGGDRLPGGCFEDETRSSHGLLLSAVESESDYEGAGHDELVALQKVSQDLRPSAEGKGHVPSSVGQKRGRGLPGAAPLYTGPSGFFARDSGQVGTGADDANMKRKQLPGQKLSHLSALHAEVRTNLQRFRDVSYALLVCKIQQTAAA
jgi:hypothetical protein